MRPGQFSGGSGERGPARTVSGRVSPVFPARCPSSLPAALPGLCVLNYLEVAFASLSPRCLPPCPAVGARALGGGGGAGDRARLCASPAAGSLGSRQQQRPGPGEGT